MSDVPFLVWCASLAMGGGLVGYFVGVWHSVIKDHDPWSAP